MKKLQIMLLILLLMTMTACGNAPEMPSSDSKAEISQEEIASTVPAESQTEESSSQEASAETNTDTTDPVQTKPETGKTFEKEAAADKPKQNKAPSSQAVNDPSPDEINEKGSGTPEPEEGKPQEQPQAEESKIPEPPAETKPKESKIPEPEPEKTPEPEPEPEPKTEPKPEPMPEPEPVPQFDIDYWIGYAQSVATSKGLVLESTAVDCWDNPITANPDCIYLERDISGYLSRYAADEDITDVWIWYECIGENKYLIYIGYA